MRTRRALGRPAGKALAVAGLAVVVLFPAALTVWTAIGSNQQVAQSARETQQFGRWQAAEDTLNQEHALVEEHTEAPSAATRARLASTAAGFDLLLEDLEHATSLEPPAERGGTLQDIAAARAAHARYRRAAGQVVATADQGEATRAQALLHGQAEELSNQVAAALAAGAQQEADDQAEALAALRRIQQAATRAALVALAAGVGLVATSWRLLRRSHRRLHHQALHDGLTGLPNRTLLRDRTGQTIRLADRELAPAALLLLDLDRFKEVNDTLGHHYGDQLLIQVGQRLQATLRKVDTVARLGGDEFAVLLPRIASAEGAVAVARKLQAALAEPFVLEGLSLQVEASIGLAVYPEHGSDPEELLQHADIAMYTAKQTHAGFVLFDPTQDQHSPRKLALLGELRRAIEAEQLLLHYQPKVDAHSVRVLGVEALVRWQHPTHGLIPPSEFIPLAEHTGLISPLTHYVLDAALRQVRQWQRAGHQLSVAVNVSARRLLDLAFPDEVAGLLQKWEVPAQLLVVEITESTIMADPEHAMQVLGRLNQLGVQVSIDDFGTGYSSMAYLKSLPVHELKVDRSFVAQMTSNSRDAVIVRSTVDLGRNLGLRVVAEGVEDQTTLQELDALGCDAVQGYHVSRPVPPDELITWLQQQQAATPDRQRHH
jgi:diguanylate cyclase